MKLRPLTGTITALATPFRDGQVSYEDLRKLVAFQIKGGIDGLVPVGTTGESPTLSYEEHMDVIRCVVSEARGRVPVIAGTGSNSTYEALHLTKLSHESGADAMLVVAPYYNKPSQEGLFRHFAAIADSTDKPKFSTRSPAAVASRLASVWSSGCARNTNTSRGSRKPAAALIAWIN